MPTLHGSYYLKLCFEVRADKKREPQNEKKTIAKTDMKRVTSSLMILASVLVYKPVNLKKKLKRRITSYLPSTYLFWWDGFVSVLKTLKQLQKLSLKREALYYILAGRTKTFGRVSTSKNVKLNMLFVWRSIWEWLYNYLWSPISGVGERRPEY